jgi:hypothetical protein
MAQEIFTLRPIMSALLISSHARMILGFILSDVRGQILLDEKLNVIRKRTSLLDRATLGLRSQLRWHPKRGINTRRSFPTHSLWEDNVGERSKPHNDWQRFPSVYE